MPTSRVETAVCAIRFAVYNREFSIETSMSADGVEIVNSLFDRGRLIYTDVIPHEGAAHDAQLENRLQEQGVALRAQIEDMFALLDEAGQDPGTDITLLLAQLFETRGLYDEAARLYESVCTLLESDDRALHRFGLCLTELGEYNRATELLSMAVRLKPLYADYRNALGIALAWSGKISDSLRQFDQALELNTYYADAHYCVGIVTLFNGIKGIEPSLTQDFVARALKSLEKSVLVDPALRTSAYENAVENLRSGNVREAFGELRRSREGVLEHRAHSYEERRAELLSSLRSSDRHYIVNRIRVLVKQLADRPDYVDLSYDLATAYLKLAVCEWQTGLKQFEKTLERTPDLKKAVRAYDLAFSEMSELNAMIDKIEKDTLGNEAESY